jgi:proteasome lid subunit RPN8/RPN11
MRITLPLDVYGLILEHCRGGLPLEACGLVAGRQSDGLKEILAAFPIRNADASRSHFSIDPRDQLGAVLAMRSQGLSPLGNFHSHPETPARPSGEDLRLFVDRRASYLIVSLAGPRPAIKSFQVSLADGQPVATEEELDIV